MLVGSFVTNVLCNTLLFLFPLYQTFKILRTENEKEYKEMLYYWALTAAFCFIEFYADIFISWFPFYYDTKLLFAILVSQTQLSKFIYNAYLHPFLLSKEVGIDATMNQFRGNIKIKAQDAGYKLLGMSRQFIVSFIVQRRTLALPNDSNIALMSAALLAVSSQELEITAERQQRELVEREQAKRDQARREQAEREQAERDQAKRDQAEREQAEREQAKRDQVKREQAEREQAEREQAKREQAEREQRDQAKREQAEREQVEREKAKREQAEKEQAEREQSKREQVEREKAKQVEGKQTKREQAKRKNSKKDIFEGSPKGEGSEDIEMVGLERGTSKPLTQRRENSLRGYSQMSKVSPPKRKETKAPRDNSKKISQPPVTSSSIALRVKQKRSLN